jgi:hypothetical protein
VAMLAERANHVPEDMARNVRRSPAQALVETWKLLAPHGGAIVWRAPSGNISE